MNIIKRVQSDGLANLITLITKKIKNLFYRRVKTLMFELKLSSVDTPKPIRPEINSYTFKSLGVSQSLFYLSSREVDSFRDKGGKCITLSIGNEMVGYIWCFSRTHQVDGVGDVNLEGRNALWVGPVFVHKKHRGLGYNKALLQEVVDSFVGRDVEVLLTSINSENIPSIKSFESYGFINTKCIESTYVLGKLTVFDGTLK